MSALAKIPPPPSIGDHDGRELLRIARAAIREHFLTGLLPPGVPHRPALLQRLGAGVAVQRDADANARSCAIDLDASDPIYLAIEKLAVEAALRGAIAPDEIPAIAIVVALLGAPVATPAPEALVPGLHGVVVTRGPRRGITLPDVTMAPEALLDAACAKAALPPDSWRDPTVTTALFTATLIAE